MTHFFLFFKKKKILSRNQTVPISTDIRVEPFDCNIFTPPDLAAAGYKMINSAWTPLYIAANGRDGMHHPVPPEQVYRWNPWLFGTVVHSMEWFQVDPNVYADSVVGAQMCVWQMPPTDTLCMLSSRLPAMAERVWNPWSSRTFEDYSSRVTVTGLLLDKLIRGGGGTGSQPSPPPTPPTPPNPTPPIPGVPGFTGSKGACRDSSDHCGKYIFTYGPNHTGVPLAECAAMCVALGDRCDAYDFSKSWCGVWGSKLTSADNRTDTQGSYWKYDECAGTAGDSNVKVCQAVYSAGPGNTCFLRTGAKCDPPPPPTPPPPSPIEPGCLAGCSCV